MKKPLTIGELIARQEEWRRRRKVFMMMKYALPPQKKTPVLDDSISLPTPNEESLPAVFDREAVIPHRPHRELNPFPMRDELSEDHAEAIREDLQYEERRKLDKLCNKNLESVPKVTAEEIEQRRIERDESKKRSVVAKQERQKLLYEEWLERQEEPRRLAEEDFKKRQEALVETTTQRRDDER